MNPLDSTQRRADPRVKVEWPVTMMTPEGDMDGIIENISAGGAFIRCGTPLSKKDLFILSIRSQDRADSWIGAEVVWIDVHLSRDTGGTIGMGVRFTNISAEDLRTIDIAVSEYS